jgi:DnaK suppressor protein
MEWMTREEIAKTLGIVVNSVRGKVKKGQIERVAIDGKNLYRLAEDYTEADVLSSVPDEVEIPAEQEAPEPIEPTPPPAPVFAKPAVERPPAFSPKLVLMEQLASISVGRSIDAIEKGDEIDLATGEISRDLDARISMRQHKQIKEIEDALERVKLGEYGLCEECGETVPEQRLRLFPAARLCVRCQEEADRYEKLKDEQYLRGGSWRDDISDSGYGKTFDE